MLLNMSGGPVYNSPGQPFINFTNPDAREWWVSSCVAAITQQLNGSAIDGVWIDGAGDFEVSPATTNPYPVRMLELRVWVTAKSKYWLYQI